MKSNNIVLSSLFNDGMVLQRASKVSIWGEATPMETLNLEFQNKSFQTSVDSNGKWEIKLNNLTAGGPFEMLVCCGSEQIKVKDILVGDVWVLGGQSNMEIPISRTLDLFEEEMKTANNPNIRQFVVPLKYDFDSPCEEIEGGMWNSVTPSNVISFSAIGYFYAKALYEKYGVPIGMIRVSLGGTPVEAWMSEQSIAKFEQSKELLFKCKDANYVNETQKIEEQQNNQWYQGLSEKDLGLEDSMAPWYNEEYDDSNWNNINLPRSFHGTELENVKGSIWFRKELDVPESMLKGNAKLVLGTLIDGDDTYLNGVKVGNTGYLYPPRRYNVPEGLLKKGKNILTVRLITTGNVGAFITDMPYVLKTKEQELPLAGEWKYHVGVRMEPIGPTTFFQYMPVGVYNGMIYPLRNYCIKGVLWYQGESNTGDPNNYKDKFEAVIKDWRTTWNIGDFPFLYVQLPNFMEPVSSPCDSNWAYMREEQRRTLEIVNTRMVVAIDIGMHNDLHPWDKKTVGNRLALQAMNLVYGEDIVYSGPMYENMEIIGDKIHLHFKHIGSGLIAKGGELKEFAISGKDRKFVIAEAKIHDNTVIVSNDTIKNPTIVRYAWADNPQDANLYNIENLPASPFTTEIQ